jgi:nucleotide-binding universal stress UspA family protein
MFKRILVPLDGSTRAERALPVAARIARATSGSVVLVQVATIPVTYLLTWHRRPLHLKRSSQS